MMNKNPGIYGKKKRTVSVGERSSLEEEIEG